MNIGMDRKYFYIEEGKQNGPLLKEELTGKINPETLIWYEGLDNWKKASEIYELLNLQLIPPPIPDDLVKSDKKIEVIVKKEKEKLISAKSEIVIAREIKSITYSILVSLVVALIGFLIKSQIENSESNTLLNKFNNHKSELNSLYEQQENDRTFGIDDPILVKRREQEFDKESVRLSKVINRLYEESKLLGCYQEKSLGYGTGMSFANEDLTIESIERRISYGNQLAFNLSIIIFFISLIVLIVGRYAMKSVNWVNKRT
jgi:hypothetical protein